MAGKSRRKVDQETRFLNKEPDFSQPLFHRLSHSFTPVEEGMKPDLRVSKLAASPTVGGVKWLHWQRCRCGAGGEFDQKVKQSLCGELRPGGW